MKKYFFFDTACTVAYTNARIQPGPVCKSKANPLFAEDFFSVPPRPWEVRYDNGYPNVFYDPALRLYRCYYTLIVKDPVSEQTPLAARPSLQYLPRPGRITALCYAQSPDGFAWEKPSLGLVEFDGSRDNNIVMLYAHGASVFRDEKESDPEKRYKMMLRDDRQPRGLAVSFSRDGFCWSPMLHWPRYGREIEADSFNFAFREPESGQYHFYSRKWSREALVIAHSTSRYFFHWSKPAEVFRGNGLDDQIYAMPVFKESGLYWGLCSIFHDGDRAAAGWDRVDLELAYSGDGKSWERIAPGIPLIPRGSGRYPDGSCDSGCIYAGVPVYDGEGVRLYYMGGNGQHTNFRETGLCCARLGTDRYAGLFPLDPQTGATLTTSEFCCGGGMVYLTADLAPGGLILADLFERDGSHRRVFRFENQGKKPKTLTQYPAWELTPPQEPFFLQFTFCSAALYSLSGEICIVPKHGI